MPGCDDCVVFSFLLFEGIRRDAQLCVPCRYLFSMLSAVISPGYSLALNVIRRKIKPRAPVSISLTEIVTVVAPLSDATNSAIY